MRYFRRINGIGKYKMVYFRKVLLVGIAMLALSMASGSALAVIVADSNADYSTTDGTKGWWYRYEASGTPSSGSLQYRAASGGYDAWYFAPGVEPYINSTAQNVKNYSTGPLMTKAVRRWINGSTSSATATIYGDIQDNSGISARDAKHLDIKVNGVLIGSADVAAWPAAAQNFSFSNVVLSPGDVVDFIIGAPNLLTTDGASSSIVHFYIRWDFGYVINVKDNPYNAKGDGVTDDTTAIQNAIGTGNRTVFVPDGTYMCGNIQLKSNLQLIGESHGAILRLLASAHTYSINGSTADSHGYYAGNVLATTLTYNSPSNSGRATDESNNLYAVSRVLIKNLTLDGNRANNVLTPLYGGNDSLMGHTLNLMNASYVDVENVRMVSPRLDCVLFGYSTQGGSDNCTIRDSYMGDYNQVGVHFYTGKYNVLHNVFIDWGSANTNDAINITPTINNEVNYRHFIEDSVIRGKVKIASIGVSGTNKLQDIRITNNRIQTVSSIDAITMNGNPECSGSIVEGNMFTGSSSASAFKIGDSPATTVEDLRPIIIRNNNVYGYDYFVGAHASPSTHNHLVFQGNKVETKYGFSDIVNPYNVTIQNNSFRFLGGDNTTPGFKITYGNTAGSLIGRTIIAANEIYGGGIGDIAKTVEAQAIPNPPGPTNTLLVIKDNVMDIDVGSGSSYCFEFDDPLTFKGNIIHGMTKPMRWTGPAGQDWGSIIKDNRFYAKVLGSAPASGDRISGFSFASAMKRLEISGNHFDRVDLNLVDKLHYSVISDNVFRGAKLIITYNQSCTACNGENMILNNSFKTSFAVDYAIDVTAGASFVAASNSGPDFYDGNVMSGYTNRINMTNTDILNNSRGLITNMRKIAMWGTAAPTVGTYEVGDEVLNTAPSESGSAGSKYVIHGWVCTVAGTPGTWLQMRARTGN